MARTDFAEQAVRGTPAVLGAVYSIGDPQFWVMLGTGVYIVIQIAYLVRKWWREEKEWGREEKEWSAKDRKVP